MPVLLPIGRLDAGPARAHAPVTALMVLACVAVFAGPQHAGRSADWVALYGAVPADLWRGGAGWPGLTLVTSLVTHASWPHLLYNLFALWVFGAAVEPSVGSARFAAMVVAGGVLATLAQAALWPASEVPIVGASGAVAVVAGAFAVAFPRARVIVAAVFLTLPVRIWVALSVWVAVEAAVGVAAAAQRGGGAGTFAHGAHLAGLVLGIGMMGLIRAIRSRRQGIRFLRIG